MRNWSSQLSNSWRISGDIYDNFDRYNVICPCESYDCFGLQGYMCSMVNILEKAVPLGQKAGPTMGWNDLDSLKVDNGGMSAEEYKALFTLWAISKSPLIWGNDVSNISVVNLHVGINRIYRYKSRRPAPGYRM